MSGRFSLVIFDLDGVVVDSAIAMARAVDSALESVGVPSPSPENRRRLFGPPLYLGFASLLEALGADPALNIRCADLYRQSYRDFVVSESRIYDGMTEVLDHLLPSTPLAVATSKPREFALLLLNSLELSHYFLAIGAPDSETALEPKALTIARIVHPVLTEGPGAVHVGDTAADVVAAKANDIPCAGALWGFGTRQELQDAGATWLVEAPRDLIALLRSE